MRFGEGDASIAVTDSRIHQQSNTGLVIAAYGRRGILETDDGETLKYQAKGHRLRVVCGDRVEWERHGSGGSAIVQKSSERDNALERQPPDRPYPEVLAANLGCIVVVCAASPETNWFLVDRYLATAELMGCRVVLVDNKIDIENAASNEGRRRELAVYRELGYSCVGVSAHKGHGIDQLLTDLSDTIAILVGQSGVGKSSLINALVPNADILVGALSAGTAEGKHTTTASVMHQLPGGGRLIDTPGVRDFVPVISKARSVEFGFLEISALIGQCRFNNCRHRQEPDCAVKRAVELATISPRRFESYCRLVDKV